jgi:hypothetical protein
MDRLGQELRCVDAELSSDALDAAQREIALPALHPTHVGPVNTQDGGECLLRKASTPAVVPKVLPKTALQLPFHGAQGPWALLEVLQTYQ